MNIGNVNKNKIGQDVKRFFNSNTLIINIFSSHIYSLYVRYQKANKTNTYYLSFLLSLPLILLFFLCF